MKKEINALLASLAVLVFIALNETNSRAAEQALGENPGAGVVSAPSTTPEIVAQPATKADTISPPLLNTKAVKIGTLVFRDNNGNQGSLVYAEFEKRPARRLALFVRPGWVDYKPYDSGEWYREYGRGYGLELGGRFYIVSKESKSFYLGAGFGMWQLNWTWKDEAGTAFETSGHRRSRVSSFQVHCGWKFALGSSHAYLNPTVQIGSFFPSNDNDPIEFGNFYTSLGLALGMDW